jgi:hypothetical protein
MPHDCSTKPCASPEPATISPRAQTLFKLHPEFDQLMDFHEPAIIGSRSDGPQQERNVVLFENRRVVTEFERFFETALESSPRCEQVR